MTTKYQALEATAPYESGAELGNNGPGSAGDHTSFLSGQCARRRISGGSSRR